MVIKAVLHEEKYFMGDDLTKGVAVHRNCLTEEIFTFFVPHFMPQKGITRKYVMCAFKGINWVTKICKECTIHTTALNKILQNLQLCGAH